MHRTAEASERGSVGGDVEQLRAELEELRKTNQVESKDMSREQHDMLVWRLSRQTHRMSELVDYLLATSRILHQEAVHDGRVADALRDARECVTDAFGPHKVQIESQVDGVAAAIDQRPSN